MRKRIYPKSKNRLTNLERYSGKWVAFVDNQPVSWANDLNVLMQKVKKSSLKKPSVMLIPRKDEGPYILLI